MLNQCTFTSGTMQAQESANVIVENVDIVIINLLEFAIIWTVMDLRYFKTGNINI